MMSSGPVTEAALLRLSQEKMFLEYEANLQTLTTLWHGCSPVNLLHIFRTLLPKNTSGGLHL